MSEANDIATSRRHALGTRRIVVVVDARTLSKGGTSCGIGCDNGVRERDNENDGRDRSDMRICEEAASSLVSSWPAHGHGCVAERNVRHVWHTAHLSASKASAGTSCPAETCTEER